MISYFDKLYKENQDSFFNDLEQIIINEERAMLVTANPEVFSRAEQNKELHEALMDQETMISPDGEGVVKAARILNYSIWGKIAGVDTVQHLLEFCNQCKKTVFFYGSKQEVLDELSKKLKIDYPNIIIKGMRNGYDYNETVVFDEIKNTAPDLILVALGVPKQELAIYRYLKKVDKGLFIGVGGSLDVLSGVKKRAPKFIIRCKLEWLFRLLKEPRRIKKFYQTHITFLFKIRKLKR